MRTERFIICDSKAHQGATARIRESGTADQLEAAAAPNAQVFCLDGHDGENIRQIENANQSCFSLGDFATGLGGDDLRARPRREVECAGGGLRLAGDRIIGLGVEFAHAVFANDASRGDAEQGGHQRMKFRFGQGARTAFVAAGFQGEGAGWQLKRQLGLFQAVEEVDEAESGAEQGKGTLRLNRMAERDDGLVEIELPGAIVQNMAGED